MTTDTYNCSCRCGTKSPRFSSREARTDLHEACPARRAKPGHQLDWEDLEKLQEDVRRLRPIAPEMNLASHASTRTPRDSSLGAWGPPEGDPQRRDLD